MRNIYYYQQSYFAAPLAPGILTGLRFTDNPGSSDLYCIETYWKGKDSVTGFDDADDQPYCGSDADQLEGDVGLSFV